MSLNRKGLTLIEVVIAAALVGIVGVAVGALISSSSRQMIQVTGAIAGQNAASFALEHMKRHMIRASDFDVLTDYQVDFTWTPGLGAAELISRYEIVDTGGGVYMLDYTRDVGGAPNTQERLSPALVVNLTTPAEESHFSGISANDFHVLLVLQNPSARLPTRLETRISPRGISGS